KRKSGVKSSKREGSKAEGLSKETEKSAGEPKKEDVQAPAAPVAETTKKPEEKKEEVKAITTKPEEAAVPKKEEKDQQAKIEGSTPAPLAPTTAAPTEKATGGQPPTAAPPPAPLPALNLGTMSGLYENVSAGLPDTPPPPQNP
uniref:Uncharacterized protein n=1 Tax=Meloidogyne javanica TaxID=6303 RepID=A0A915LVR7_MELJA